MAEIRNVSSPDAPTPVYHYSQAQVVGDFVFTAGHIATDAQTGALVGTTVAEQTAQVVRNLRAVLEAAGSSLDRVLKTTVFLVDLADFPEFNRVYAEAFGAHRPARSTVAVADLMHEALVEIECVAARSGEG